MGAPCCGGGDDLAFGILTLIIDDLHTMRRSDLQFK
jgi:hypothetical protein